MTVHPALAALLTAHTADPDPDGPAAAARRAEVMQLVATKALRHPQDQLAAAGLLLPSTVVDEVRAAEALALSALSRDPAARPLAAAAFDRLRLLAGRPQKFGTQVTVREGRRVLWPVDPATTDSERAKWGVPALVELLRRVEGRD